jgi:hypothetical protein
MENPKKEISRSELDNGEVLSNHVLCRAYYSNEGAKTKAGIVVGFNNENTYASEDGKDTSSHVADLAETSLIVYKTPKSLYFNPEDPKSMDWETTQELQEGDIIFTNPIDALNSLTLVCEGEEYKLINYQDIYVSKRLIGVTRNYYKLDPITYSDKYVEDRREDIFTLNGYILCTQVAKPKLSDLDVISEDKIYQDRGVVRYIGKPNARYRFPELIDFKDLKIGDLVLFDRKSVPFLLERTTWNSKFDDKLYWCIQRKNIVAILNRKT